MAPSPIERVAPATTPEHDAQVELHRAGAPQDRLGHRAAVDAGHGQPVVEEHQVEAALFERAAQLLVVARGEEAVLGGRMAPRTGVHRRVPRLHEPHQRHLPLRRCSSWRSLACVGSAPAAAPGPANVECDMSDFKSIGGTVRSRAATELRDRILTGRLRPGTRLDLDEITEEFGTSRTPVREALLELSYEGLVAVTPRSGITVSGITPEDAVDNFARAGRPGRQGGRVGDGADHRPSSWPSCRSLADAIVDGDDVVAANRRFHRALNLASGSPRLLTYLRQAVRVVPANYFELFPEQERRSRTEHAALLEAIGQGDAAGARAIAEAHVLEAGAALGDWLRARPPEALTGRRHPLTASDRRPASALGGDGAGGPAGGSPRASRRACAPGCCGT